MNDDPTQFPRPLGRYELVHLLGQGGMGEVYLAKISGAAGFEKPCIVKTILPALLKDRQFLDRFHHEAKVLVHLVHSSIAQVYDMGEAEGTYYMALEYVAGVDLSYLQEQARAEGQSLPVPVALYLGQRIAEGLGYAHRKTGPDGMSLGIVHRDVSPHNVMVSYEGEVKVIDFGLAKSAARSKYTLPSTVMGKLGYMSPEQVRAEAVDHRSDIYSCGVVVWELIAGQPLFAHGTVGEMMAAMSNPTVPALHELRPDVDPALDAVVRRALAPNPADRYARADDFARALNEQLLRSGSSLGAEEVGNFVRAVCPEAFASQRKLLSRLSTPGLRRTPVPGGALVPASTARYSPLPLGSDNGTGYESTLVRSASGTATPTVSPHTDFGLAATAVRTPATTESSSGPLAVSRKGWTVAIILGALGLVGASAGVTAVMMARPPPPPHEGRPGEPHPGEPRGPHPGEPRGPHPGEPRGPHPGEPRGPHPGEPRGPEGGPRPFGEARPGPGGAVAPTGPETGSAPTEAAVPPAEQEESEAKAPAAGPKLVPAEKVAGLRPALGGHYVIPKQEPRAGLTPGMVLQVVAAPVKDKKARLLGEATVMQVRPKRTVVRLDPGVREAAGTEPLFVVLPEVVRPERPSAKVEPHAPASPPELPVETATPEPTAPVPAPAPASTPRELKGRISFKSIGPFNKQLVLTQTDDVIWSDCKLIMRGRDMYKLGGMAPGGTREIPLSEFKPGPRDLPYVEKNRIGLFCTEGERKFPAKL